MRGARERAPRFASSARNVVALAAALTLAFGWLLATAGASSAADAGSLVIRKVDTTAYPKVKVLASYLGETPAIGSFTLRENERIVDKYDVVPLDQTTQPVGIVLTIDVSGSMRESSRLDEVKTAAKAFVAAKAPLDQIAVVAFSNSASTVIGFTSDTAQLTAAIDNLVAGGNTALYDGITQAMSLFSQHPELQANVIILSDGGDSASTVTLEQARGSVVAGKATAYVVGITGTPDFNEGILRSLADVTKGLYVSTADSSELGNLTTRIRRSLSNQFEITYQSAAKGSFQVTVTTSADGGAQAVATDVQGGTVSEGAQVSPDVIKVLGKPGLLQGERSKWIVLGLIGATVAIGAFALIPLFFKDESALNLAMRPYDDSAPVVAGEQGMAQTAFLQRAVAVTGRLADERGFLDATEKRLEQAALKLRPAEALFFWMVATILATMLAFLLSGYDFILTLLALALGILLPPMVVLALSARRKRAFTALLPDALTLLAGTLRAGYSLQQGLDTICREVEEPMGSELRRVMIEASLGRPVEQALEDCATRMGSADFDWAIMAIRIQREVGGNLAELLDTVADTMLQRERLRREVSALTAEGRISALVIGGLPFGLGGVMYAINPTYMTPLFHESIGKIMLGVAFVWAMFGFWWMYKTIQVEV